MQFKEDTSALLLEKLSFISTLRDVIGAATVINALYTTSNKEWEGCFDANTGSHLIKGVFTSSQKSDAVRIYISKLMAQYMRSIGVRVTAWTKVTIASENFTNVAISNRIAATEFKDHTELFTIVATRLMGFDDGLIKFALAQTPAAKALALVTYLAANFDLVENTVTIMDDYVTIIDKFTVLFEKGGFDNAYFLRRIAQIVDYYLNPVNDGGSHLSNPFDVLDMLGTDDKDVLLLTIDAADPDPAMTISLLQKEYNLVDRAYVTGTKFNTGSVPEALLTERPILIDGGIAGGAGGIGAIVLDVHGAGGKGSNPTGQ